MSCLLAILLLMGPISGILHVVRSFAADSGLTAFVVSWASMENVVGGFMAFTIVN